MLHVILGASPNERRYSFKATELLFEYGYKVFPVGIRSGEIIGINIERNFPEIEEIDTIAMYLSAENQFKYQDLILKNMPKRVVFNPGTHNADFQKTLAAKGVEVVNDCVLVMVRTGRY
jgi:predicted CoA-binding protein